MTRDRTYWRLSCTPRGSENTNIDPIDERCPPLPTSLVCMLIDSRDLDRSAASSSDFRADKGFGSVSRDPDPGRGRVEGGGASVGHDECAPDADGWRRASRGASAGAGAGGRKRTGVRERQTRSARLPFAHVRTPAASMGLAHRSPGRTGRECPASHRAPARRSGSGVRPRVGMGAACARASESAADLRAGGDRLRASTHRRGLS